MPEPDAPIRESLEAIGVVVGRDVAYFGPPDDRRLDPLTVAVAVGGFLLKRYLEGVSRRAAELSGVAQAGDMAEDAGAATVDWLAGRLRAVFAGEQDAGDAERELSATVQRVRETAGGGAAPEALDEAARIAGGDLADDLRALGIPEARIDRILTGVARQGRRLIDGDG